MPTLPSPASQLYANEALPHGPSRNRTACLAFAIATEFGKLGGDSGRMDCRQLTGKRANSTASVTTRSSAAAVEARISPPGARWNVRQDLDLWEERTEVLILKSFPLCFDAIQIVLVVFYTYVVFSTFWMLFDGGAFAAKKALVTVTGRPIL